MRYPDLGRYEDDHLERMLYSYRTLAREHLDAGHYALAAWATKMVTHVSIELNVREMSRLRAVDDQLTILPDSA